MFALAVVCGCSGKKAPPPISLNTSTVTTSRRLVRANGESTAQITVLLADESGNPIPNVSVEFVHDGGEDAVLVPAAEKTGADGTVSASLSATAYRLVTVGAVADPTGNNQPLDAAVTVRFLGRFLVAVGQGGTSGKLYHLDLTPELEIFEIGDVGHPVAALALSDDGRLFGTTPHSADLTEQGKFLSIDVASGTGTVVAETRNAADELYAAISGLEFIDSTLYGWVADGQSDGHPNNQLVTIGTENGLVTPIGDGNVLTNSYEGNELAVSPTGEVFASSYDGDDVLLTLNLTTGVATKVNNFVQNSPTPDAVQAAGFDGATLYGVESDRDGNSTLVTIDTATAATTAVGALPANVEALTVIP